MHSVYELLCFSTRKIAPVAYAEARHRKLTGLHAACIMQAFVHVHSNHRIHRLNLQFVHGQMTDVQTPAECRRREARSTFDAELLPKPQGRFYVLKNTIVHVQSA